MANNVTYCFCLQNLCNGVFIKFLQKNDDEDDNLLEGSGTVGKPVLINQNNRECSGKSSTFFIFINAFILHIGSFIIAILCK